MPAPPTTDDFVDYINKSGLLPPKRLDEYLDRRRAEKTLPDDPLRLAQFLVRDGLLTKYQAEQLLAGRWRNFFIGGKYKLLEKLGKGGMAMVFLCEHQVMRRLVALKILPLPHAEDRELLGRFHREARRSRSSVTLNIVGAYDIDNAGKLHFLVMEYVDGGDLDLIVQRTGPMPYGRAANYIRQAAHGLQHAHDSGLVHRDIKPGNLLVDRAGTVKLLDLGLARIFHETSDDLTTGRDARTLLGTVDYLAPEQALNSHDVDIRADIYSLGATFYYLLTGKGLFEEGTVAQKLSWHLHRPPVPISEARPDVPEGLGAVLEKMLAKRPEDRYQTPDEVVDALEPWTRTPIEPPTADELPQLSRAARGSGQPSSIHRIASLSAKTVISSPARHPDGLSRATKIQPTEALPAEDQPPPTLPVVPLPSKPVAETSDAWWKRPRHIAAMIGGLLAIGVGGWWAFLGPREGGSSSTSNPGISGIASIPASGLAPGLPESTSSGKGVVPPADQPADATFALASGNRPLRPFPTLREALRAAKSGERIEVRGSLISEAIELSDVDGSQKNLILEGVNPKTKGAPVRWRAPRDLSQGRALLDVSGVERLRIKGFLFDGQGRVAELVRLSGRGAGATVEDLQFEGATRAGLVLRGWSGESEHPATIQGARFATARETEAAVMFEADPDRPTVASESIRLLACRFVGPFQAAILIAGPVSGLDIEQCRFSRASDGLRYRRSEARGPLRVRLANNVFADIQRGLHFETTPPAASSEVEVTNNVFCSTNRLATLDKVSVQPSRVSGRWIWTDEGKKSTTVPPGVRLFRKSFDVTTVPDKATLDISCDETYTVWLNGLEVARNPSPHYTQRVYSHEVGDKLRRGRNVLAVQGTNQLDRLDSKFGTTAGLLAQITAGQDGKGVVLVRSDETWKWSEQAPESWTRADFDDRSWTSARAWPETGVTWPWIYAVWDSAVLPQLKPPLELIRVTGSGNVRDYKSWEGYPSFDSERSALQENALPRDPEDDATFLRYRQTHPLFRAGPNGTPIGVFED